MKRLALVVAALLLSVAGFAQQKGFVLGFTTSNASIKHIDTDAVGQFHFGMTSNYPLFAGLSLQPELLYNRKGTIVNMDDMSSSRVAMSYLELGVQAQFDIWPSFGRLYAFAEPYLGYGLSDKFRHPDVTVRNRWYYLNKLEGGFALGLGIQFIENLQLSAKVYWNLGSLYNPDGRIDLSDAKATVVSGITGLFQGGNSYNGMSLSLVYYFE